jgi:hypothetical protein
LISYDPKHTYFRFREPGVAAHRPTRAVFAVCLGEYFKPETGWRREVDSNPRCREGLYGREFGRGWRTIRPAETALKTVRYFIATTNLLTAAAIDSLAKRCDDLELIVATLKRAK